MEDTQIIELYFARDEQALSETEQKYGRFCWQIAMNVLSKKYDTLRVVNDQIGTPTYTLDLARLLVDMIETDKFGYYHATNEGGYISWYDFACEIFRQAGYSTKVVPVTTAEYGNILVLLLLHLLYP